MMKPSTYPAILFFGSEATFAGSEDEYDQLVARKGQHPRGYGIPEEPEAPAFSAMDDVRAETDTDQATRQAGQKKKTTKKGA